MYIFENQNYTEEDLGKIADIKGYTFDELLEKNPSIKKTDPPPNMPTDSKTTFRIFKTQKSN